EQQRYEMGGIIGHEPRDGRQAIDQERDADEHAPAIGKGEPQIDRCHRQVGRLSRLSASADVGHIIAMVGTTLAYTSTNSKRHIHFSRDLRTITAARGSSPSQPSIAQSALVLKQLQGGVEDLPRVGVALTLHLLHPFDGSPASLVQRASSGGGTT